VLGGSTIWAYPFGPPNGYTVAPGDKPGVACTQCHTGTALNGGGGSVRVAFTSLTYTPGQAQIFNIVITDAVAATYGFEMSARMESGPDSHQAGNFTAGQNQKVVCSDNSPEPSGGCGGNGIQWIEHTQPSLNNTIAVQWTAPATASGNIHLYVSANATNGDNSPRGDHIYAADYVLTPASTVTSGVPTVTSIVNAASGAPGAEAGSWITINGANFAANATTWDNSIIGVVFPTTVGGVTVAIDGRPAPIAFVNQTQINALVPATPTLGDVSVVVSNSAGSSTVGTLTLSAEAPGLFTFSQSQGKYPAAIVLDNAGAYQLLAPSGTFGSSTPSRAAKAGDTIVLYGTAFGRTTTPVNPELSQTVAFPLAHTGSDITQPLAKVTIGGQAVQLLFCGIVSPGVYQVNAVLPSGLTPGDQPLSMTLLSGASVSQTLMVPVQ
jgi:uncharacterized protein (TIGR03437 family)